MIINSIPVTFQYLCLDDNLYGPAAQERCGVHEGLTVGCGQASLREVSAHSAWWSLEAGDETSSSPGSSGQSLRSCRDIPKKGMVMKETKDQSDATQGL